VCCRPPGARVDAREVEVEHGAGPPRPRGAPAAGAPVPALFAAAPAGPYTLLLGDPDAGAPRYDVARARDVVLAVPAVDANAGAAEPNPLFSQAARLAAGGGSRRWLELGAVWVVLLIAVVVLGLLTFRTPHRPG